MSARATIACFIRLHGHPYLNARRTPSTVAHTTEYIRRGRAHPGDASIIRTFLLRPGAFFEQRRDRLNGLRGGGLALGIAVVVTIVLGVALRLFADQFTGTVERDNPARPPEQLCEDGGVGGITVSGCDEPATQTVEVGSFIWNYATRAFQDCFSA